MPGKKILVLTSSFPDSNNSSPSGIFVKEQILEISKYFENIDIISRNSIWSKLLKSKDYSDYSFNNVNVHYLNSINYPITHLPSFFRNLWIKVELWQIIRLIQLEQITFDLIHAHYTWYCGAIAVRIKNKFHVPVVITEHTSKSIKNAIKNLDPVWIKTWKEADSIIRVKSSDISQIQGVGISKQKITYIPNGYNQNEFYPQNMEYCREILDLPIDKNVILYVANFYDPVKGHIYLVDAVKELTHIRTDIIVILIGSGKLEEKIRENITHKNLWKYILMPGERPHKEIPIWMNACDLFVMPSHSESFGIVQIEAMACGKPVVATRNGGSEEIITSERYGLLVDPGNSAELAEKISEALNREWDKNKILEYVKRFTWENIAREIVNLYSKNLDYEIHVIQEDRT